jgi:hypothetical protein
MRIFYLVGSIFVPNIGFHKRIDWSRFFFVLPLSILFFSCKPRKEISNSQSENLYNPIVGKVHLGENTCPYFIEVEQVFVSNLSYYLGKKIYPVQLNEEYQKNNLVIRFNPTISRAPSPENCAVDFVVTLENISIVQK